MRPNAAFTLLELMVVVGLIGALAFFLLGGLGGGGKAVALQSAQATLVNLVNAARLRAMATGQPARLLVHTDSASSQAPARYLRYVVLQGFDGTNWVTQTDAWLPDGIGIVPREVTLPDNLIATAVSWTRPSDGGMLRSTALRPITGGYPDAEVILAVNSAVSERWAVIKFAAAGTTLNSNDLIVASFIRLAPGSYASGQSPLQFSNPNEVRGLSLSAYGVPALINSRAGY